MGSILLCGVTVELALRYAEYEPFRGIQKSRELILRESPNPDMIYELTPNMEGVAWGQNVKINSFGFRDREYSLKKPDGTYRMVVLGDSITFGNFLPVQSTYAHRLELLFERRGVNVEILNLSVSGYNTTQEIAFLEEVGLQFNPDEVIVGYCMNDLGVVSPNLTYIARARGYNANIYNLRSLQYVRAHLDIIEAKIRSHPTLINYANASVNSQEITAIQNDAFVSDRIQSIAQFISSQDDYHDTFAWYSSAAMLSNLRSNFDKLKSLSQKHGFRVSVVIIPYLRDDSGSYSAAYDIIRYEARRNKFDTIDILDKFKEVNTADLQVKPDDQIHPNELGHRLIAQKLFEYYTEEAAPGRFKN